MHNRHSLHRQIRWRWIRILFAVVLLAPIVTVQPATPPPPVHADALSDAVAEQMKLDKLIADQKKLLAGIAAKQVGLQQQMTATQQNIDNVSSDMDTLQSQMDLLQVQVDQVRTSYEGLVTLEGELAARTGETAGSGPRPSRISSRSARRFWRPGSWPPTRRIRRRCCRSCSLRSR
jgi:septal ring factor EnvC (AmiA/AmiB activator)